MRTYFLFLLVVWVGTITLGSSSLFFIGILATIIAAAAVRIFGRYSLPFCVALLAVGVLGSLYGSSVVDTLLPPCEITQPLAVTITARPVIKSESVQYNVQTPTGCHLLVSTGRFPVYEVGDQLQLRGGKLQYTSELPPESAGYQTYLKRLGISASWQFPTVTVVTQSHRLGWYGWLRQQITTLYAEPEASLVSALLIGDVGSIPSDIQDAYRLSGTNHILSISGLHISLLAGIFVGLSFLLPLSALLRTLVVMTVLGGYVLFIGAPVAAIRALLFWLLVLLGLRLQRLVTMPILFGLTAGVLITLNPLLLQDISFQLSFGAVCGMFLAVFIAQRYTRVLASWQQGIYGSILISVGATLTTWPLVAYHFGTVSLISPLANLLIVPLSTAVLLTALITTLVYIVVPPFGVVLAYGVHALVVVMNSAAFAFAAVPGSHLSDISLPIWFIVAYYLGIGLAAMAIVRWQGRSWREVWQ